MSRPLSAPTAHHEISVQRAAWPSDGEGAPTAGPSAIGVVRGRHPEDRRASRIWRVPHRHLGGSVLATELRDYVAVGPPDFA